MPGSHDGDNSATAVAAPVTNATMEALTKMMADLNRNISGLSAKLDAPPAAPIPEKALSDAPPQLPFGLPGYGDIPEVVTTTAVSASSVVPPMTTTGVPIHQINFPPSPSPTPGFQPPARNGAPASAAASGAKAQPPLPHLPVGVPRTHRLDFPLFDRKKDPIGWLNQCDQFFRCQLTPEADKVLLATYHPRDVAPLWYFSMERDTGTPTWDRFKELCNQRFGPPLRTQGRF
ncbi:unnamed protein product [Urochloa humidicola]